MKTKSLSIKYFLLLPCWLVMEILGKTLWSLLPLFAQERYGPVDNNARNDYEPRLPRWLAWFDTPDNSLYGDTGWRTLHCPEHWASYLGMALWLFRNSATGFSRSVLAKEVHRQDVIFQGDPHISVDRGVYGVFTAKDGHGAWQYKRVLPLFGKNIGLNFGWNIDPLVKNQEPSMRCHYKVSLKLKDRNHD